jgi:two-component sensor histidine kinase
MAGDLALAAGRDDVRITLDLCPLSIPASMAAPFALVLNELLTNALRHAFPGQGGVIAVSLARTDEGSVLTVADDGCGMGEAKQAFGLTIVNLLCRQLRSGLEIVPGPPGVRATVRTPLSAV